MRSFVIKSGSSGLVSSVAGWVASWSDVYKLLALVVITIFSTYYASAPVAAVWYVILLAVYYFSRNEALWLALFLTTSDGFFSYFGAYTVTLTVLPGLPAVEVVQLYIILSVIKAAGKKKPPPLFYYKYLQVLLIYMIFNIIWGQMMGLSGGINVYFRVIKGTIPMLLFYSVPRLFVRPEMYERFFRLVFVIVLFALVAQVFTLFTGYSPMEATGITLAEEAEDDGDFRVFYNVSSALLGMFGALYVLTKKTGRKQGRMLPLLVVFAALSMTILSATRGWIISFSLITLLVVLFTGAVRSWRSIVIFIVAVIVVSWALSNNTINEQLIFARDRLETIGAIAEGDLTAEGTLQRLDYRSRRVISGWKENPLFGWGLSDKGYEFGDGHVGNQSLLATSGIAGYLLINGFIAWFIYKLLTAYSASSRRMPDRNVLVVFVVFMIGWFIIHSTSGQQFNYAGMPARIIPQAVFFSFGALIYNHTLSFVNGKKF